MNQEDDRERTCCFFGHRKIDKTQHLIDVVCKDIENLIVNNDVNIFLFGSKSQFNDLCYTAVTELRVKYSHIKRIYVRAEFSYIDDDYKNYLLHRYEDTYYPERLLNAGKAVYVERNYEMIDKSKFSLIYYDENYAPPRRRNKKSDIIDYQPKSGTKLAYDYASRKGLIIINEYS